MACPYFFPIARFEDRAWAVGPRLPLGDPYLGECRAQSQATAPDESTLRQLCNRGYGRAECQRFPPESDADAVRFHVSLQQGTLLQIQYIFEKSCWPVRHGVVEFRDGLAAGSDAVLDRQAAAFAESYLRRSP